MKLVKLAHKLADHVSTSKIVKNAKTKRSTSITPTHVSPARMWVMDARFAKAAINAPVATLTNIGKSILNRENASAFRPTSNKVQHANSVQSLTTAMSAQLETNAKNAKMKTTSTHKQKTANVYALMDGILIPTLSAKIVHSHKQDAKNVTLRQFVHSVMTSTTGLQTRMANVSVKILSGEMVKPANLVQLLISTAHNVLKMENVSTVQTTETSTKQQAHATAKTTPTKTKQKFVNHVIPKHSVSNAIKWLPTHAPFVTTSLNTVNQIQIKKQENANAKEASLKMLTTCVFHVISSAARTATSPRISAQPASNRKTSILNQMKTSSAFVWKNTILIQSQKRASHAITGIPDVPLVKASINARHAMDKLTSSPLQTPKLIFVSAFKPSSWTLKSVKAALHNT